MATASAFWDRHALGYSKRPVSDEAAYQKKLRITQDYFRSDMEVLEFGCGTGTTALYHSSYVNHIHAIDISAKMLEIARAKAEDQGVDNIEFQQATIEDFDVPEETYDVIMGHSILHLLEDKDAAIAKVFKMLKPGGHFITSTAVLGGKMPWLRVILPIGRFFGLLPLVKFFTADELEQCFRDGGFRIDHRWQPDGSHGVFMVVTKG